jgi:hypothetical protein
LASNLKFTSPFVSRPHALSFADRYAYADDRAASFAVRDAHDTQSALYAIRTVSEWKAGSRNDWRLTADASDVWKSWIIARNPSNSASRRFAALDRLGGVGAPIASTILTFLDDRQFTIVDWRTWTALGGNRRTQYSWDDYRRYLSFCRTDAQRLRLDLRTYDKALWVIGGKGAGVRDCCRAPSKAAAKTCL